MPNIRETFKSRFGDEGFLVEFDFCQLEICALAEISQDRVLIEELNRGVDIHRANAAEWLNKDGSLVTDDERTKAKVMTFQLQYGARAPKIASTLGISVQAADDFINAFYNKYMGVKRYHNELDRIKIAHEVSLNKQAEPEKERLKLDVTPTGRIYTLTPKLSKSGRYYYSSTEIKNYPIQGFGTGDIVPIVINMVYDELMSWRSVSSMVNSCIIPINTVHDSSMFDCMADYFIDLLAIVETVFEEFPNKFKELFNYDLKVKYNYDVKYGNNWAGKQMHKLSREDVQALFDIDE